MSDFDPDWPHGHVTRDGRKARIICKDRDHGNYPIVALVKERDTEVNLSFTSDGRLWMKETTPSDLINAPAPKRKYWANIYLSSALHESREAADANTSSGRIACIEFKEGDGL